MPAVTGIQSAGGGQPRGQHGLGHDGTAGSRLSHHRPQASSQVRTATTTFFLPACCLPSFCVILRPIACRDRQQGVCFLKVLQVLQTRCSEASSSLQRLEAQPEPQTPSSDLKLQADGIHIYLPDVLWYAVLCCVVPCCAVLCPLLAAPELLRC